VIIYINIIRKNLKERYTKIWREKINLVKQNPATNRKENKLRTYCKFKFIFQKPKGGNQNPYIEEEQTTQWPKEKVRKDKQRSTKHAHKTKDRVTRTPLKTGGELRCSGMIFSSCSTSGTSLHI
jgi:hypothetical protein